MNSSPERDGFHALRTYYTKPGCVGKMVNIYKGDFYIYLRYCVALTFQWHFKVKKKIQF